MSEPLTLTEVLPQGKNRRRPAMEWTKFLNPTGYAVGHLTIHNDRSTTTYRVDQFPADDCIGICLAKLTPGTDKSEGHYCLAVSPAGVPTCECRGFTAHGNCKHRDAVQALLDNKWLTFGG